MTDFRHNRTHIKRATRELKRQGSAAPEWDAYQALQAVLDAIEMLRPADGPPAPELAYARPRSSRFYGPEDEAAAKANEDAVRAYREQCKAATNVDPRAEPNIRMAIATLERVLLMRLPAGTPKTMPYCAEFLASIHEPQDPANQQLTNN